MRNRLRRSAREAVRNEYRNNVIYLALKTPCEHFCEKMPKFHLSAEEVFLECLSVLDDIKEDESRAVFNLEHRWDSISNDFRDLAANDVNEKEIALATSVVIFCVVMCLTIAKKQLYSTLALRLMGQIVEHDAYTDELKDTFMANVYRLGEGELQEVFWDYMESDEFLSDEIEEMVEQIENVEDKPRHNLSLKIETSDLKIAEGKETSMLVVLDTMYKAGWFVDKNNKPTKNKNKTIGQIMKYAFNKNTTNVSQLLHAAYTRNLSDNREYFDELLEKLPKNN